MNLAPVEQYFADYLSILETRSWKWEDNEFSYNSNALLSSDLLASYEVEEIRESLGLSSSSDDNLWEYFLQHGIGIPFNLIVAGTVNMDETTHGFSRKVIDRALSFDFGEFFPNDFDQYFNPTNTMKSLSYPIYSDAMQHEAELVKFDADLKSREFLKAVNEVLKNTSFALAYRALNELYLSVITHQPEGSVALQAIWDDFLMCKILPRIEGDMDKLGTNSEDNILTKLGEVLTTHLSEIWEGEERPDLFRELKDGGDKVIKIKCRSKAKLNWMKDKLQNGYTTFWQ